MSRISFFDIDTDYWNLGTYEFPDTPSVGDRVTIPDVPGDWWVHTREFAAHYIACNVLPHPPAEPKPDGTNWTLVLLALISCTAAVLLAVLK